MNSVVKSIASRYGLIAAMIGIAFTLIAYLVNLKLLSGGFFGIGLFVLILILFIIAVNSAKKAMGGYISFRDAFTTFTIAYIINSLIVTSFNIILFNFIDPEAAEELQEMVIEKTVGLMERFGAPESQIESQIETLENTNTFSIGAQVTSFFWGIVFFAVVGLIVAAFMKKNKPEFIEDSDSEQQ